MYPVRGSEPYRDKRFRGCDSKISPELENVIIVECDSWFNEKSSAPESKNALPAPVYPRHLALTVQQQ